MKVEYAFIIVEKQPQILRLRPPRRTSLRMTSRLFNQIRIVDAGSC